MRAKLVLVALVLVWLGVRAPYALAELLFVGVFVGMIAVGVYQLFFSPLARKLARHRKEARRMVEEIADHLPQLTQLLEARLAELERAQKAHRQGEQQASFSPPSRDAKDLRVPYRPRGHTEAFLAVFLDPSRCLPEQVRGHRPQIHASGKPRK